jgi:hypothetical protein
VKYVKLILLIVSSFACGSTLHAQDYGKLMTTKVKAALGNNAVKGYVFSTYPLDNFGLATAYESKQNPADFICATWECVGISDDQKVDALSDDQKLKVIANNVQYATVGTGTSLNLTEDEKRSISLKAILPKLFQVLDITGDLSHSNEINTTLSTGPITVRILRRADMTTHIKGASGVPAEQAAAATGDLILVYSDIVISTMKIEIKTDPQTTADLEAKLSGAVGKVFSKGADLSFKLDNSTKGDYSFSISKPLILAVYAKKQPRPGVLGGGTGWHDWPDVDLGSANKVTMQSVDLGGSN